MTASSLVQAAAPVLKVGQQTSVRHVFPSLTAAKLEEIETAPAAITAQGGRYR